MEEIKNILTKLAHVNDIEILLAVEAGSRAWGFESIESDYDIRFVYKSRTHSKYISLKDYKDTIDGFSENRKYDWQGWDIRKALKLLCATNPSVLEWLFSPLVYYSDTIFLNECHKLVREHKLRKPLFHHYKSMTKSNYQKHLNNQLKVPVKHYLYVIRPALMALWILKRKESYLMIKFDDILSDLDDVVSDECKKIIREMIQAKKLSTKLDPVCRQTHLDELIGDILKIKDTDDLVGLDKNVEKIPFDKCDEILLKYIKME